MANSSPAVLSYAIALIRALLTPARGRHSVAARRRRSTRVRRYAAVPVPAQASAPPAPRSTPRPTPRLAPPRERIQAEEVALVRGYYRAFENERDLARAQAQARARLDRWTAGRPTAPGDLLAPIPQPRRPEYGRVAV